MTEPNGNRIRQEHGNNENDQSQLTVDAQPLSPRIQTSPQPVKIRIPGACVSKESRTLDESIPSETPVSGEIIQLDEHVQRRTWFSNKSALDMPSPSGDWCFNNFLTDLAKEITDKELGVLKGLFTADIGRGIQEKLTTPMAFFDKLRTRLYLDKNNLLWLQTILRKLDRPELIQMAIEYAQTEKQVIHFNRFTEQHVNGYRKMSVHVDGIEFRQCKRSFIEDLRTKISVLLFIEPQYVLIAGIEPSSSMLITILIPDTYADILEWILEHRKEMLLRPLSELHVDIIMIDEKEYSLKDAPPPNNVDDQQVMLKNIFEQFQDKLKQLESLENELQKQIDRQEQLSERNRELELTIRSWQMDAFKADKTILTYRERVLAHTLSIQLTASERQILKQMLSLSSADSDYMLLSEGSSSLACVYCIALPLTETMRNLEFDQCIMEGKHTINRPDLQTKIEEEKNQNIVQETPAVAQQASVQSELVPSAQPDIVPTGQTGQPEGVLANGRINVDLYNAPPKAVDTAVILPVQPEDVPIGQPTVVQNSVNGKTDIQTAKMVQIRRSYETKPV